MSPAHGKLAGIDRPGPDEALSPGPDARPRADDHDNRELLLDDPALLEVSIDEDDDGLARGD